MSDYNENKFGQYFFDQILDWIDSELEIDDVFSEKNIEYWLEQHAEDYGYVKEEE